MQETSSIAAVLEAEHHQVDSGLAAFRRSVSEGAPDPEAFLAAAQVLRRHIYLEEEFLFPPLRNSNFSAPVMVMLREHGEIWRALDAIEQASPGPDRAALQSLHASCLHLDELLEAHDMKEEQVLYPAADQRLAASDQARVHQEIGRAVLPAGWQCEGARG